MVYSLYALSWGSYLFFISQLMFYFSLFLEFGMVNSNWNFGQIVGITVWAEPLVEYAYLELSTSFVVRRICPMGTLWLM